jgi:hypothetical protein
MLAGKPDILRRYVNVLIPFRTADWISTGQKEVRLKSFRKILHPSSSHSTLQVQTVSLINHKYCISATASVV